jgi:hypothetical protein
MAKITLTHPEHGDMEVDLPEGYLSPAEVKEGFMPKAIFQAELGQRVQSIIRGEGYVKPSDLYDNEEFKQSALEKWQVNIAPDAADAAKERAAAIEEARRNWEAQHLTPAQEAAQQANGRIEKLLLRDLHNQIATAAADVGIQESLRKSPVDGQAPPIVHMLAQYFGYDEKTDGWAVKTQGSDGQPGYAYSAKPTDANPYQGVREFMSQWAGDEANKQFVVDQRQRGPGMRGDGPTGEKRGGVVQISFEDSQNAQTYREAKAKAEKAGATIEITDRPY